RFLARAEHASAKLLSGWRLLAEAEPTDFEPWLQIARLAAKSSDWASCLDAAEKAVAQAPDHADALRLRLSAAIESQNCGPLQSYWTDLNAVAPDRAAQALRRALQSGNEEVAFRLLAAAHAAGGLTPEQQARRQDMLATTAVA